MKYSNKRKDFFHNKNYVLYGASENCKETAKMFCSIAYSIGMPVERAIKEFFLFVKAKSHKNCLIVTILFGSPKRANRYIQGLNKKTFNILENYIEQYSILNIKTHGEKNEIQ